MSISNITALDKKNNGATRGESAASQEPANDSPVAPPQIIYGKELKFDAGKHMYTWDDKPVPGVTTILQCIAKPMLIQWAAGMASDYWFKACKADTPLLDLDAIHKAAKTAHRKKAQAAADIGTNVHDYAECFFKNKPLPPLETDQAKRGVEAFHKWLEAHNVKIIDSERRVFSHMYYYAGTCDFTAEIDGEMGVGDIKTSSGIYPEMRLQTAAYQHAIEEEMNMKYTVRWIVRFDKKTGEFEAKSFRDFELDFFGFRAAHGLHQALKKIEKEK